jgi:hypothetical protein
MRINKMNKFTDYKNVKSGFKISIEFVGVLSGIIGSFSVANGLFTIGYPIFTLSALLLLYTAFKQSNKNLMLLQAVFLLANINGLYTFFLKG